MHFSRFGFRLTVVCSAMALVLGAILVVRRYRASVRMGAEADYYSMEAACAYRALTSHYPVAESVSPDGSRLLLRTLDIRGDRFGFAVRPAISGSEERSVWFSTPVLRPRWSPDGSRIAFFTPTPGEVGRKLHIWNLRTGEVKHVSTPLTVHQPQADWSPDGRYFSYLSEPRPGIHELMMVDESTSKVSRLPTPPDISQYSWAPGGLLIAIALAHSPDTLRMVDLHGKVVETVTAPALFRVDEFHFAPVHKLLLVALGSSGPVPYALSEYDLVRKVWIARVSSTDEFASSLWAADESSVYYQTIADGNRTLYRLTRATGEIIRVDGAETQDTLLSVLPAGEGLVLQHGGAHPDVFVRQNLQTKAREILYSRDADRVPTTSGSILRIPSFDGAMIPVIVRTPPRFRSPRSAVIVCLGGSHSANTNTFHAEEQWFLRLGLAVVAVNYRGSGGYGREFGDAGDMKTRAKDLIAAAEFVHQTLDIPYDRIALMGHSVGAALAAAAGRLRPDHFGVLGLASLGPVDPKLLRDSTPRHPRRVVLLHGRYDDKISTGLMRSFLSDALGESALDASVLRMLEVPDEHTYNSVRSWGVMFRAVAEELGVPRSEICALCAPIVAAPSLAGLVKPGPPAGNPRIGH